MGVVFMAEQSEPLQRTVALKIIKPGMDTRQVISRFEAERQAVAMMDHPNIAKVLDAGTTDSGRPYFAMELVKGVPITKYCDDKHLAIRERLELFMQVCQAVQHAHQKGVIHRDIKPNNVLVAEYDNRAAVQLYSTASYQAHDLSGIKLSGNYADLNLAGQNLTNATFYIATLSGANFNQANLTNSDFSSYTTGIADLTGANLSQANLTNVNFRGYEGEDGILQGANLTGANLSGADARGARFQFATLTGANSNNLIQPDGHIAGLDLNAGASLVVRDYDGNPAAFPPTGPLPIIVDQHAVMATGAVLQLEFDADNWDSTISFAAGIPVARGGGALELIFASDVNLGSQIGRNFDLFDWTDVTPTGAFTVSSPYTWNLGNLYTTGEVTLTAAGGFILGDFNGDSDVDGDDLAQWQGDFGANSLSDADNDSDSDGSDFLQWQRHVDGRPPAVPAADAVPEPSTVALFGVGLVGLGAASRRRVRRKCISGRATTRPSGRKIHGPMPTAMRSSWPVSALPRSFVTRVTN